MIKQSAALGSALPDPARDAAMAAPIPTPKLENKTAPGQTGPRGLSPRTTYSRVNTGSPPVSMQHMMDQKSLPPRGMEFLSKTASEENMLTMTPKPTIQEMLKAAMEGTRSKLNITAEATRQIAGDIEKVAEVDPDHYPTEQVEKLAAALGYMSEMMKAADGVVPGEGPGALQVMQATSSGESLEAGQSGQATAKNQPPTNPPLQAEKVQSGNAGTGLETNDAMQHPEQPVDPIGNQKTSAVKKVLAAVSKTASTKFVAPVSLIKKLAEDAANPATISSAHHDEPPPAVAAEQGQVSVPSDVSSQQRMVGSNEAAISYTKGEAKKDPKSDVAKLLVEPPLSASTDKVLQEAFDNTGKAGVKISSVQPMVKSAARVAAARALLSNLMDKAACEVTDKKKKVSMMGAAPTTPSSATGLSAATMS